MKFKFFTRHGRRAVASGKKQHRPLITFKGEEGKRPRQFLIGAGAVVLLLLLANALRVEPSLMASAEVATVHDNGVLKVGVRTDIPGMSLEGEGLEYALAELLGEKILSADEKWDKRQDAVKFIPVTPMTASAKLTDGTVDMLFCMMPKGGSSSFAYSSSYYDDPCRFVFRKGEGQRSVKNITVGFLQSASTSGLYVPTGIYETMVDNYVEAHPDDGLITTYKYNDDTIDLSYASYDELFDALRDGEVDAIVLNDLMLNKLDSKGEFDRSEVILGNISYAAATSTATPALTSLMDVLLDDLRDGGTLEALYLRYGLQR